MNNKLKECLIKLFYYCWFPLVILILSLICKFVIDQEDTIGNFIIFEGDYRSMYPYIEHAQVSSFELGVICFIPVMVYIAWLIFIFIRKYLRDRKQIEKNDNEWKKTLNNICIYFYFLCFTSMCIGLTMMFTEVLKTVVAMPRPNFFYMCNYKQIRTDYQYYLDNVKIGQIVNLDNCYGTEEDISDSILSFPSGHSSYSLSIALSSFIFTYFMKKKYFPGLASFMLFFLAIYVGVSRIMDYYHNVWDVLFGFFLACCISATCFIIFYDTLKKVFHEKFVEF